jgi:hypothetical protein
MSAPLPAKVRSTRRKNERGAVMFIVTMTLAVLASVGIYALTAATGEVTTSGSERRNTQTHYLAEYGVVAGTQLMTSTQAQNYITTMISTPDTNCWSLPSVTSTTQPDPIYRACSHVQDTEVATVNGWSSSSTFVGDAGTAAPTPDFAVEYTGLNKAVAPAGYSLDLHVCFVSMTASSYGITTPVGGSTVFGQGLETQRARLIAGPVMGGICQ